jgi:hypothetical protein
MGPEAGPAEPSKGIVPRHSKGRQRDCRVALPQREESADLKCDVMVGGTFSVDALAQRSEPQWLKKRGNLLGRAIAPAMSIGIGADASLSRSSASRQFELAITPNFAVVAYPRWEVP